MISSAMVNLIQNEPFFANLLMNMTRTFTTDIPTAGVNITDTVNLYINPHFWTSLNLTEQVGLLKHECYHVINNHFVRFKEIEPETYNGKNKNLGEKIEAMENATICNQAADYAINEMIPNIPKEMKFFDKEGNAIVYPDMTMDDKGNEIPHPKAGQAVMGKPCLVENLQKELNPKIERHQHLEYYHEILKQNQKENKAAGKGLTQVILVDDHSIWGDGDQDGEYTTEKVKQIVAKAVEQSGGREAGRIPGNVLLAIEALFYKPKDWKNDLQKFVAKTSEIIIETSRKSRNRRYGVIYPGVKIYPKLHLAVAVDSSGSVYDRDTQGQFVAEIARISKNGVKVTVIECDHQVQRVYEFDERKMLEAWDTKGGGGTAFAPAFDKATELKVDGLIYLTDGENCEGDQLKKPKYPVMWAILDGYKSHYTWGYKTNITVKKKNKAVA